MNWSIVLGVLGIVASVLVGWLTYRLADRRARKQRYMAAKTTVLQELSNSLGEDAVPTPYIIESTIRSVLREMADPRMNLALDDVLDDLMRQVTSDPFLDRDRRLKLQNDIVKVREDWKAQGEKPDVISSEFRERSLLTSTTFAGVLGMLAALVTLMTLTLSLGRTEEFRKAFDSAFRFALVPLVVVAVIVPMFALFGEEFFDFVARLFRGRRR